MFLWSLHPAPKLPEWQRSAFELLWSALAAKAKNQPKEKRP
jgi:hypothetical protein